jgi:IS30 family transposase
MSNLDFGERKKIEFYVRGKVGVNDIARYLKRNHSVISRELSRNKDNHGRYNAVRAQALADHRARKTNKHKLQKDPILKTYVIKELKAGKSPEQIGGRLKKRPPPFLQGKTISYESIYRYIYDGEGRYENLYPLLRKGKPKRFKKCGRKPQKTPVPKRVSIHERPDIVKYKLRYGDWESDTVCFKKQRASLSVQYERKSRLVRIHKVRDHSKEETYEALVKTIESLPLPLTKTITFDNGGEGALHYKLRSEFGINTYQCDAFASWQKGGVENMNGLIRQYLPRDTNMSTITDEQIYCIQELLNNRPRKALNYLTPNEVITGEGGALNS